MIHKLCTGAYTCLPSVFDKWWLIYPSYIAELVALDIFSLLLVMKNTSNMDGKMFDLLIEQFRYLS